MAAYRRLHDLGWVHSVEAWTVGPDGRDRLAGGLYGVSVGGLFAGESMFHREPRRVEGGARGAGRAAPRRTADDRLLDVQWATEHLVSLGAVEVARPAYLAMLAEALPLPQPTMGLE